MKKLLSLLLAVLFVLSLNINAFAAESQDISFTASAVGTKTYNSGGRIIVTLSVEKINFGDTDGISALEFDIEYDSSKLVPVTTPKADADEDICDITSAITQSPSSAWEGFATVDSTGGSMGIVLTDSTGKNSLYYDNSLSVELDFSVKSNVKSQDIVLKIKNLTAYNCDLSKYCTATVEDVVVEYSAIPSAFAALPNEHVPLNVAGYRHNVNNVIFSTQTEITVADYVKYFSDNGINQAKMSSFAIVVAKQSNGEIIYVDTEISTQSDKSSVKIPANSYIIGVFGSNTDDLEYLNTYAKIGKYITVYNVNIEGASKTHSAIILEQAGFVITESAPEKPYLNGSISGSESNIALDKYYTTSDLYRQGNADNNWGYDETAAITFPDENNCSLTDGVLAHPNNKYTATDAWVGFHNATPDALELGYCYIRVDLQEIANISQFNIQMASSLNGDGITPPSSISVYGSADGIVYTDLIGTVTPQDTATSHTVTSSITADVSYRYVEFRIHANSWALISEVEVIGYYGEKEQPDDENQGGTTPPDNENQGGTTTPPDDENQGGTTTPPTEGTLYLLGDVNGNGRIDSRDYILLKRAHFGTYTLSEAEALRSDINQNSKIDSRDYLLLKRMYFNTYSLPESQRYITIY